VLRRSLIPTRLRVLGTARLALLRRRVTPARYRTITAAALGVLCLIVLTGVLVRLTGSGLGCDDWPQCNSTSLIDVSTRHAAIEQVNRLLTGLVSLGVIAAVLGALRREPRRRDLTLLSIGLVAGVIGQIVLGGITVLVDLHPAAVQGHFLLSMVLVANAVVLHLRAALPDDRLFGSRPPGEPFVVHAWVVLAATALTLVLGTIVTGAGPHAGDEDVQRYGVAIPDAVRFHSISVWVSVANVALLAFRVRDLRVMRGRIERPLTAWIGVAILQGAVGYIQYFSDVPAALVFVHVAGATALWAVTVWMATAVTTDLRPAVPAPADSVGETLEERGALVDHG
jgi:cytochrome c oxidase assembly protein subunit 15